MKFEGHGPRRSERVGADSLEIISLGDKVGLKGGAVDLVATPDLNRWQGRVEPNLMIQDLRAAE